MTSNINLIDLMVVYTSAAEREVGGSDKIDRWIDKMVLRTNMAMRNSQINLRVALVRKQKIQYYEQAESTDLDNLKGGQK